MTNIHPNYERGRALITFDVEDWAQSTVDHDLPIPKRAADNALKLLDVLERENIKSTMFVLGKFAGAHPEAVKRIHEAGHEVACHGYGHVEAFSQSRGDFKEDVLRAKDLIESIIGERVLGYRAPCLSISAGNLWALEILSELGIAYDSSIFPYKSSKRGVPDWPLHPAVIELTNGKSIIELPPAALRMMGKNWPVGGGGYHRLMPWPVIRTVADRVVKDRVFVYYSHPQEFDADEFDELPFKIPLFLRLHQGTGRRFYEGRFRNFVRRYKGGPIRDWIADGELPRFRPRTG